MTLTIPSPISISVIACLALLPNTALSQPPVSERLHEYCDTLESIYYSYDDLDIYNWRAVKAPETDSSAHALWWGSWHGATVPIPVSSDELVPTIDSVFSYLKSESTLDITLGMPAFMLINAHSYVEHFTKSLALPPPSLTKLELIILGTKLDLDSIKCDPNQIEKSVNEYAALLAKGFDLIGVTTVYETASNGFTIYRNYESSESWEHIYSDSKGLARSVKITQTPKGKFGDIGLSINAAVTPYSSGEPKWLKRFFDDAELASPTSAAEFREKLEAAMAELRENIE